MTRKLYVVHVAEGFAPKQVPSHQVPNDVRQAESINLLF